MKRFLKSSLSLLLAITIVIGSAYVGLSEVDFDSAFAVKAQAATSGTTGDCEWSLDGTVLTISGNGAMADYSWESVLPWGQAITGVIIEDGVTSIGEFAFYNCSSLTSIIIPDSVVSIGQDAFYYTEYSEDSSNWENECLYIGKHLIEVRSTKSGSYEIKPGTITIADYAFDYCYQITSIIIPESVTSIGDNAFPRYSKLISIEVEGNNSEYTSVDGVLFNKDKTILIKFPTAKVCDKYIIPDTVKKICVEAFSQCEIHELVFPESIEYIEDAFYCCPVSEVTVNSNYVINNLNFGVFSCEDGLGYINTLETINIGPYISEINPCNLSTGDDEWISVLTDFNVDSENKYFCSEDGVLLSKDKKTLVRFPSGRIWIDYTLPDYITTLGADSLADCYFETLNICSPLSYIAAHTGSVAIKNLYINSIADWCEINFENEKANPLSIAESVSFGDSDCVNIRIPDGTQKIGDYSFCYFDSIESLVIPGSVKTIGRAAFKGCENLSSITICPGVEKIDHYAFYENPVNANAVLTEILLPESVTYISRYAFSNVETIIGAKGSYAEEYADKLVYDFMECSHNKEDCRCILCGTDLSVTGLLVPVSSNVVVDEERKTITADFDKIEDVSDCFVSSEAINIVGTSASLLYGTGSTVAVYVNDEKVSKYTFVLIGDTNGDGVCDALDAAQVANASNGRKALDGAYAMAADSNADDEISIEDYQAIVNKVIA